MPVILVYGLPPNAVVLHRLGEDLKCCAASVTELNLNQFLAADTDGTFSYAVPIPNLHPALAGIAIFSNNTFPF